MNVTARNEASISLSGGQAIGEMLKLAGVGAMFGMGGFQLLPLYGAIRKLGLTHHLVNDERTGAFAADAHARVTGRPGICDGTLGPGATNLVTGLIESTNAGIPLIAFLGDTHRAHSWKNMTQEARQTEVIRPTVKELIRIEMPDRVPELVRRAFAVATSGRPGAVAVDVPEDVAHAVHEYSTADFWIDQATLQIPARPSRPSGQDVERAAGMIARARRPMLLVGGGIHLSRGYEALQRLAEGLQIGVAHTISGKGGIRCTHPLNAGLFGRYSRIANNLIETADLLIVVGCKLGEIATVRYQLPSRRIPTIHLEIEADEVGRTLPADVALIGDARASLEDLCAALQADMLRSPDYRTEYAAEISAAMKKWEAGAAERLCSNDVPINNARLISELNRALPAKSILIADGGFAAHWTGLLWNTKEAGRTFIANRGFASIGYGLPAAIGASLAAGDRPVVAITGDGGFNMTLGDLETARRAGIAPIIVVLNNAASGYVKALQHLMMDGSYQSADLVEMNYANIANAMGCRGLRVEHPDELASTFQKALANRDRPTVIDVIVTRDPARMLPGVDNRTVRVQAGDRIA